LLTCGKLLFIIPFNLHLGLFFFLFFNDLGFLGFLLRGFLLRSLLRAGVDLLGHSDILIFL
jgi:hypothetical protein